MSIEIENESGVESPLEDMLALAEFALNKMHIDSTADIEILLVNEVVMEAYHLDWMQESDLVFCQEHLATRLILT